MAKVHKDPRRATRPGVTKIELPEQVQVTLGELAGKGKQGLLAFSVSLLTERIQTEGTDIRFALGPLKAAES